MNEQIELQKILLTKFEEHKSRNPAYSRRAFSKKLGLSAGAMSELFNGRRRVSAKLAHRLADRLALDPQERAELFAAFPAANQKSPTTDEVGTNYLQLSADQFRVIGDWYHFAILTLMRTKGFRSDVRWVSQRLGLPESLVSQAIERLQRLELITVNARGKWQRSQARYRTTDDVTNLSVRKAHLQYIENARAALETLPIELRDFTSLMMTVSPGQLSKIKEKIRKFQDELAEELEASPQTEVFQLCIHLFPLTKLEGVKK